MRTYLLFTVLAAVALLAADSPKIAPNANPAVVINVDAAANKHAISENIYATSFADAATIAELGLTINRWGGNAVSRHNWINSTTNRAKDYYFENIPDDVSSGDGSNGKSGDDFINLTRNNGASPLMTIPMMGVLPKDRTIRCGYSVMKYGAQDDTDPFRNDCGNGKSGGNRLLGVNDPSDTSAVYPPSHQAAWINHMRTTFGTAANGGVTFFALDNEPGLWSFDHWDVHPAGTTFDEARDKMFTYGALIRATEPNAIITGPEEWGWDGYFYSGDDAENYQRGMPLADSNAHNNIPFIRYYLQQAHAYELQHGVRILDYFTVHFYPQSGEFDDRNNVTTTMQMLRNRSTRSLWDPNYVDESYIGGEGIDNGIVRLIPRLKEWAAADYPGTKVGITEYNWGADIHINGGTTQADILGIFGREALDLGVRWEPPPSGSYTYNAFKMYRNYDNAHSKFGDMSVSAGGTNADEVAPFAAVRSSDGALTIMIVTKSLTGNTPATVNLANFVVRRSAAVQRWQLDSGNMILHLADVALNGSSVSLTLPAQSVTLLVIPGATAPGAPTIGAATPGNASASIAFSAPANDGGANITSYRVTCNPGGVTATGAASPIIVNGLTNNVTYSCSVVAINAAGTSAPSGTVSVTPTGAYDGPMTFSATAASTSQVLLTFSAVPNATSYEIWRSAGGAALTMLNTTMATNYMDNGLTANMTYLYKVRAQRPSGPSAFTPIDAATTIMFMDDPLPMGTAMKAVHITQLRTAVNAMRTAAGLGMQVFMDDPLTAGTVAKAAHITQLRTALDQARLMIGLPALMYTDPTITAGTTTIKAAHISELRDGVK